MPLTDKVRLFRACAIACCLAAAAGITLNAQQATRIAQVATQTSTDLRGFPLDRPDFVCGTEPDVVVAEKFRFRKREILPDGGALRFTQDPSLLTADYAGAVTLRDFLVTGDVPSVQFSQSVTGTVETWSRTGTLSLAGRTVSVFNPTWPASRFSEVMRSYVGFDYPSMYWGEMLPPGVSPGSGSRITLRFASNTIPNVTVRQLAPDVQYSSSVVNIRLDGFGDNRAVEDSAAFAFSSVTKKFYQYFEDSYDTIAVVTQDTTPSSVFSAFHRTVRNDVKGIGLGLYDDSAIYGSAGRLYGIEFFSGATVTANETTSHEAAHQWADFIDWTRLTGLSRAGHQADVHDPLMTGGDTMIGAVLWPTRRVGNDGAWVIEQTPSPIGFHPVTLYAMGLIPREGVADITLFDDQSQFNPVAASAPAPGTAVSGATRSTTMASVVGMLGARQGPVLSELQRAIVIVSGGRLLTQREMSYWTFYAQRTADPNRSSVASYDGFVSFDAATGNAIDLKHEIRPIGGGAIIEPLPIDYPNLAPTDLRGVTLDAPFPTLLNVGAQVRISGQVTATDRSDFTQVAFILQPAPGNPGSAIRGNGTPTGSGGFTVNMPVLQAENVGRYYLTMYLFYPNSGSQQARSIEGPVTIF